MPKSWKEILKERQDFVDDSTKELQRFINRFKLLMWGDIAGEVIGSFDTYQSGKFKFTIRNQRKIRKVEGVFKGFQERNRNRLGKWMANRLLSLLGLNRRYVQAIDKGFGSRSIEEKAIALFMEDMGWDILKKEAIKGGYIDGILNNTKVKEETVTALKGALSGRMDKRTFTRQFKSAFVDEGGIMDRHYRRFVHDTFIGYDRAVAEHYRQAAKMEYFIFMGQEVANSRSWCKDKKGKIFHVSIYDVWQKENWRGKIEGQSVKIRLGGYSCVDRPSAISSEMAARMIKEGREHGLSKMQLEKLFKSVK